MGSEQTITRTSNVELTIIFQNSPYWKIKILIHRETKAPCVCLSLKRTKSLRFSTPLSQNAEERGRYGSQIKLFVLGFESRRKDWWGWSYSLGCAVGLEMPWTWEDQWGKGANCTKSALADNSLDFFSDSGNFLCSFCTRCYRGTRNSSRD